MNLHSLILSLTIVLGCASASAQAPCESEGCRFTEELIRTMPPVKLGPFENGKRVVAARAQGSALEMRIQTATLHEVFTQEARRRKASMQSAAQKSGRLLREAVCVTLPPSAWQKRLLSKGGTLRYLEVSFDDIPFAQLDLTSCSKPVSVTVFDKDLPAKYAKRDAEAQSWARTKRPYVYTPGDGCSLWEYGVPASLWGNQVQVREAWTQPDSGNWGALTGFYPSSFTTYYFTRDEPACNALANLLTKAYR